jgi:hypothetical protein
MKKVFLLAGLGIVAGGAVAVYFVSQKKPAATAPAAQQPKQSEATIMPIGDQFRPIEATIDRPNPNVFGTKEQRDQIMQSIIAAQNSTQMRQPTPVVTPPTPVDVIKNFEPAPAPILNKNPNIGATIEPVPTIARPAPVSVILAPTKNVDPVFVSPPIKALPPSKFAPEPVSMKDFSAPLPNKFKGETAVFAPVKGKF